MSKYVNFFLLSAIFACMPLVSFAGTNLAPNDPVGISFWIISVAMVAATAFFFLESLRVKGKFRTSLVVGGLICLVAGVHYFYMREVWASTGSSPTVFRYVDWIITVPLQMVEFYLILAAVTAVSLGVFWRLLIGTVVMVVAGYLGEAGFINTTIGFVVGMAGWIYILYEIFSGEASASASKAAPAVQSAFNTMKWIVTIGWAIYPLGYFLGYMTGGGADADTLNIVYNVADFINKIGFCLAIWAAATTQADA